LTCAQVADTNGNKWDFADILGSVSGRLLSPTSGHSPVPDDGDRQPDQDRNDQ
jgi:hypothetical protein